MLFTPRPLAEARATKIRPYVETDEAAVVRLWTDVFVPTAPHHDPVQSIRRKLVVGREQFFVALVDDRLVGTLMCGYDGHRGWLYSLAVDPRFRRRGIGTALMQHGESELRKAGCPKINLQVLPSNSAVVALYQRLGYAVEQRISMGKVLV